MEVILDFDPDEPALVARFDDPDDLVEFLYGFWEMLLDE